MKTQLTKKMETKKEKAIRLDRETLAAGGLVTQARADLRKARKGSSAWNEASERMFNAKFHHIYLQNTRDAAWAEVNAHP